MVFLPELPQTNPLAYHRPSTVWVFYREYHLTLGFKSTRPPLQETPLLPLLEHLPVYPGANRALPSFPILAVRQGHPLPELFQCTAGFQPALPV